MLKIRDKTSLEKIEQLILKYQVELKQIKTDLNYHREQIKILEQQDILIDKFLKELYFFKTDLVEKVQDDTN